MWYVLAFQLPCYFMFWGLKCNNFDHGDAVYALQESVCKLSVSDSCLAKRSGQSSVGWKFIVKMVMYRVYIMFVLNTILF